MSWFSTLFGMDSKRDELSVANAVVAKPFHQRAREELDKLEFFVKEHANVISPAVYSVLRDIDDELRPLLTYMEDKPPLVETEVYVQSLLTDYIPTPLSLYLNLPLSEQKDGGKSDLILLGQYVTLEKSVRELSANIYRDSVAQLETHAIFIQNKFNQ